MRAEAVKVVRGQITWRLLEHRKGLTQSCKSWGNVQGFSAKGRPDLIAMLERSQWLQCDDCSVVATSVRLEAERPLKRMSIAQRAMLIA